MNKKLIVLGGIALSASGTVQSAEWGDLNWGLEVRSHYRYSEENRFATEFPFPPEALPVGDDSAFLETVDAGDHLEVSMLALLGKWQFSERWAAQFRLEAFDKYERNPTSTDHKFGVDTLFIRYGEHFHAMQMPTEPSFYAQLGKFPKMERQRARRTESYGLVSTAFNRFEDSGLEAGFDLPSGIYGKISWTTGNPVFMRDPNALAGDNGTPARQPPLENPDPELKSGIVILYDAEIESFDLNDYPEYGAALGYRWQSVDQTQRFDAMFYGYQRELAEERSLHGTFYGTDLDIFDLGEVPGAGGIRLPAQGNDKTEYGLNIWYEQRGFALFAQWVEQEMAGLGRSGQEVELSYVIDLPKKLTPVLRYSTIDNDFQGTPNYPAPSVWWDWDKVDVGVNLDFSSAWRLTFEYSFNDFVDDDGNKGDNNEGLVTLRWRYL